MGKIYSKQMESINLQIFESVIFSQDLVCYIKAMNGFKSFLK